MNVAVNLGRARVMRTIAAWLEKHPDLPIRSLTVNADGSVDITPADSENAWPWREREIHDLYAFAEAVGAEVEFAPDRGGSPTARAAALEGRLTAGRPSVRPTPRLHHAVAQLRRTGG